VAALGASFHGSDKEAHMHDSFIVTLTAAGPHLSLGAHAETYARLIRSWSGDIHNQMLGKSAAAARVEAHFARVLEGRAVQDVWITPARDQRGNRCGATLDWYGGTLRVFDPPSESWRTTWTDPVSRYRIELVGRRQGEDIVQIGTRDGRPIRWTFTNLRAESFDWQTHVLGFDGQTWQLEVDIQFRRQRS
jgi:hypothetical protein